MMNNLPIELELRKLGLTEKEVKVYLAGLELGPTSVQNIAKRAGLTRPTTYEIIRKLHGKNLFAELRGNKKRLSVAQSPEKILSLLRTQKREIEEKEREFIRIISTLEAQYPRENEGIKIFKGEDGLKALKEIVSFSSVPEIILINPEYLSIDPGEMEKIYQEIRKRLGKIEINKINLKINGSLIISDKVIFFPRNKREGLLIS